MNNQSVEDRDDAWEKLTISNDFIFGKIMSDPILCRDTLRRILPELNIDHVAEVVAQKDLKHYYQNKGSRLDVYVVDTFGRRFDLEMQLLTNQVIKKRSRYYLSMMDANELLKGCEYDQLSDSYVIFICLEDLFGKGLHKYTFKDVCVQDKDVELNDGAYKIFLNTKGTVSDIDADLKNLLDYVDGKGVENDDYIERLQKAVEEAKKNETWRGEYMTERDIERRGYLQGEAKGKAEGKAAIEKALSEGLLSEEVAKQLISMMEENVTTN